MENKNDDAHHDFYELIQKFMSEKDMKFVKKHIDTIELEKIKIKDRTESTYMDLMKFTVDMLVNYYKCHNSDAIMCTIFGLAPAYWCNTLPLNKPVKKNLLEINEFRSLLTAGDSSTMKTLQAVSKNNNIQKWLEMAPKMAYPSCVALHAWMIVDTMKLTGLKPVNFKKKIPGGKMVSMPRRDVMVYLSYMVTISETMAKSPKNSWVFLTQFKILKEFNIDLHYMAEKF